VKARLALAAALVLAPGVARAVCAPAATAIFPASGIAPATVSATIFGSGLDGGTVTVFGDPGVTATAQGGSDTQLSVQLQLDPAAAPGERLFFVDTPGGTTGVSFTVEPPTGPVVSAVTPPLVATLGLPLDVMVTGTNLATVGVGDFAVSGAGVSVTAAVPTPDGTMLMLSFAVDPSADLGTHAVTLTTGGGSVVLQLYVQRPGPSIEAVHPAAGEVGSTVPIMLTGTNLTGAALVITGTGVAVGDVATPDDGTLTATLTIDPAATLSTTEPRLLVVTTESGQTTTEFFVVPAGVPTVTGIEPAAGEPNKTVAVTLHGLHLMGGMVSESSVDLSIPDQMVVDDETITLHVDVAPGAATNTNHTLTVTTGSGSSDATFRVIPTGTPFIGAVRPPFGNRGTTFTLVVQGVNLLNVVPGTGLDILDPSNKVTESNAAAIDNFHARATITISPVANIGSRQVRVTLNDASSFTTPGSPFRVNNPGQVPSITDVSPHDVASGATTTMTVTGSNFAGAGVVVTGPGAVVSNTMVDASGTVITFDLGLAADAPAENRAVIVVTENGTARCGISTTPTPPPFLPAKLVKTGALFLVTDTRFRLFVFEFSESPLFPPGLRTWPIADADGSLTLTRLDAVNVERAFRERHRGWVRVRAVTPTNLLATTPGTAVRR